MPVTAAAIAQTLAQVAGTIGTVKDQTIRRRYEQNLALLDLDQKTALNKSLLEANSEADRQRILAETLGNLNQVRINALVNLQTQKEKQKTQLLIAGLSIGAVLILGVIYFVKKK